MNNTLENSDHDSDKNDADPPDADRTDSDHLNSGQDPPTESPLKMQSPIRHFEDTLWYAPQGPRVKAAAWAILIGIAVCIVGLTILLILTVTK